MALYKYDGPYDEVEVRVAGEDIGIVQKGGSIVIPDELAAQVEFQDYWTRADQSSDHTIAPDVVSPESSTENEVA